MKTTFFALICFLTSFCCSEVYASPFPLTAINPVFVADRPPQKDSGDSSKSPKSMIGGTLSSAFSECASMLRATLIVFVFVYSTWLGLGIAFGQARVEDIYNLVLGSVFMFGASYIAAFLFPLATGAASGS